MEVKKVEVKDLNLPDAPGLAPQIVWGEDFENFDSTNKIIYLKKLCSALNHAADLIQKERNELSEKCKAMAKDLESSGKMVDIRKDTLVKAITDHNAEKQELIKRIQELEVELKSTKAKLRKYEE